MKGQVVVTGASRGIGRALCLAFAARGHPIVACARSQAELESLAREIAERFELPCEIVAADLATPEGRRVLETRAAGTQLPTVGLVNDAGFGTAGPFESLDAAQERTMIRLNVEAVVDLCHAFLPRLRGQAGAFIVNVASAAAFQPVPLLATYSATKAFVLSLSEALAEELAPAGIHVMALCPGVTETGFQKVADVVIPGGKIPSAEDVAGFALMALDAQRRVAVHGTKNALMAFSVRFGPRTWVAKVAKRAVEPWLARRGRT